MTSRSLIKLNLRRCLLRGLSARLLMACLSMACLSMALATGLFAPSNVYAADQPAPDNATIPPAETSTASPAGELGAAAKAQSTPLEQTVETFITSEEIDTDKAVDFPTNI